MMGVYDKTGKNNPFYRHGLSQTPIYKVYRAMKNRCYAIKDQRYNSYGARGITVCDTWKKDFVCFYNWAIANGYKSGLTIDRKDNDGNYEPSNCRWITRTLNNQNKRSNKLTMIRANHIRILSRYRPAQSIARLYGVTPETVRMIVKNQIWKTVSEKEITGISKSKPIDSGTYPVGFKGIGMCNNCAYSTEKQMPGYIKLLCTWYGSACKGVSRNCSGIKAIKEFTQNKAA